MGPWSYSELLLNRIIKESLRVVLIESIPNRHRVVLDKIQFSDHITGIHLIEGYPHVSVGLEGPKQRYLLADINEGLILVHKLHLIPIPHLFDFDVEKLSNIVIQNISGIEVLNVNIFVTAVIRVLGHLHLILHGHYLFREV